MCMTCIKDEATFYERIGRNAVFSWRRAVVLYHEGFTVSAVSEIIGFDPLTVAYWIEEYA